MFPWPGDSHGLRGTRSHRTAMPAELACVTAIYTSRTEFSHEVPSTKLFDIAMSAAPRPPFLTCGYSIGEPPTFPLVQQFLSS